MAKTDLHMNISSFTVQPPAPANLITVRGVTDIKVAGKSPLELFYGDANFYPRCVRPTASTREVTVTGGGIAALWAIPEGSPCTIVFTLDDALNRNGGEGSLRFTIHNALRDNIQTGASNNKYASGTVTFTCFGTDDNGTLIDPVSFTEIGA